MWSKKYEPGSFDKIASCKAAAIAVKNYDWKKPLIIYGATGVGKSMLVRIIAKELGYGIISINNENMGNARHIADTASFFAGKKLIYFDEPSRLKFMSGRRNMIVGELKEIFKITKHPIVITTCDINDQKVKNFKNLCTLIQLKRPMASTITNIMADICRRENIKADKDILKRIASNANGDVRAAINDLQSAAMSKSELSEDDMEIIAPRDTTSDIFRAMSLIFSSKKVEDAIKSTWDINERPDNVILWIDENVPLRYSNEVLCRAYYYISRADTFIGRITSRQYWGYLRYANALMTAGVALSRGDTKMNYVRYNFPGYISKMGKTKSERNIKKSIGEKFSPHFHISARTAAGEYIPLMSILLRKNKINRSEIEHEFDLDPAEISYLVKTGNKFKIKL